MTSLYLIFLNYQRDDLGTAREQAEHKRKIQAWKSQLKSMLQSPVLSRQFSGKYPTKFGKLELPLNTGTFCIGCNNQNLELSRS